MALNSRQVSAVKLLVYTNKQKQEIAREIGITNATLTAWLNKEEFQAAVQKEMHRSFAYLATKAKNKMEQLLDSSQDAIAFAAAKELLNKAGYAEAQKIEQEIKTQVINVEVVDEE